MRYYRLDITLEDDLVFSQRSATQGDHQCRDLVPGTALWGWAAAWLHRHHPAQAMALAHEGRLRFSDARPLGLGKAPTRPTPLVWVYDKDGLGSHEQDGRLLGSRLLNLAHPDIGTRLKDFAQAKGLRGGYVSDCGELVRPRTGFRLKTALDAGSGTVKDGQLFGYDSLQAGQAFSGTLRVADDADPAVIESLLQALRTRARLGRSRSGEYGRVSVAVEAAPPPAPAAAQGETVVLWLLSDALLRDRDGRPSLVPDPLALGLHDAVFVPARSALRHRSYSAWNAHRNTYGIERQCLVAGSVLVFERRGQPFTADELALLQAGIGTEQVQGLGEVCVNPPLLRDLQPRFEAAPPHETPSAATAAVPSTPLAGFLLRKGGNEAASRPDAEALAREWCSAVRQHLRSARSYAGLPEDQPLGPGASQWGRLSSALQACRNMDDFHARVASDVLKPRNNEDWTVQASGDALDTLARCMRTRLEALLGKAKDSPAAWREAIRAAAHACDDLRRRELHLGPSLRSDA